MIKYEFKKYDIKDIKNQLPKYYKNDNFLNSYFESSIKQFNKLSEAVLFYRNLHSIIYCPEEFLFLLERDEGIIEVNLGLLKYLSDINNPVIEEGNLKTEFLQDETRLKYIDYTFKRRERLICKNFMRVNTFSNNNFRNLSSILGIDYVSLKWDKESGIVDVLVSRDKEIDDISSSFIIEIINIWIPAHLKLGSIYSTLEGQVVSDFTYDQLEERIYRNIEELIYTRESMKNEKGGIEKWRQYLLNI
ncbi:MAG: hypothetical protein ACRCZL_08845 [Cetobacterium sp.]